MTIEIGISMNYHLSADNIERAYIDHTYFDVFAEYDVLCRPILQVEDDRKLGLCLDKISGIVFTGGMDLDTRLWDKPLHEKAELVHPRRQEFDLRLLKAVLNRKMPVLGICLGLQVINMAMGGEICQHIPEMKNAIDHGKRHDIKLHKDSKLREWLGCETVETASAHHQGIIKAGAGLLAAGVTEDGIVEAVEMPGYPFLTAVQWHPEKTPDELINRMILDKFIEASSNSSK